MQRKVLAFLVTYGGEPRLTEDDQLLQRALENQGAIARPVCWDDPQVQWCSADIVVVRSSWNYIFHLEAFRAWIARVSAQTTLVNDGKLLLWNVDKRYLLDLRARGVRIIPSLLVENELPTDAFYSALERFGKQIVIKPTVSCGSHLAKHFLITSAHTHAAALAHLSLILRHSAALVQPLLNSVFTERERSLVFIDGEYSHTAPKEAFTEGLAPTYPRECLLSTPQEVQFCEAALSKLPVAPKYARVDILQHEGQPVLNEMELIEPELHFHLREGSAAHLASALIKLCQTVQKP